MQLQEVLAIGPKPLLT